MGIAHMQDRQGTTKGHGRPWYLKEAWVCGSAHTIISAKVDIQGKDTRRDKSTGMQ